MPARAHLARVSGLGTQAVIYLDPDFDLTMLFAQEV
jgi:hypothetical protein